MTPAARLSAAIEVMADIEQRRRPASDALKDWGLAHRFAGSGDRAAIAGIAYDALRRKASAAFLMGEDTPRAVLLGMLRLERGMDVGAIARLADGARFAPAPLSEAEQKSLRDGSLAQAPAHIAGDYPEWLDPHLVRVFGEERAAEAAALARRAPLDLRVNTLKADRDKTAKSLDHLKVAPTRWSPFGLRITLAPDAKNIAVHSEPAFLGGLVEVQDEGSQIAALLAGARPGMRVVDFCAGAGGKTLALAAAMRNRGKLVACDTAEWRLERAGKRLRRAGISNVERRALSSERDPWVKHHAPKGKEGGFDRVFVDAPCLGIGSWRRNPDAKWRSSPQDLAELIERQHAILDSAARLVKPGGRLIYATCSLLREENEAQAETFLDAHGDFMLYPAARAWAETIGGDYPQSDRPAGDNYLRLTPAAHGTDGFFVALFERRANNSNVIPEPEHSEGVRNP